MATKKRTFTKSVTWRIAATSITFFVSYILTNQVDVAGAIASIDGIAKIIAYYYHDRVWLHIKWGRLQL